MYQLYFNLEDKNGNVILCCKGAENIAKIFNDPLINGKDFKELSFYLMTNYLRYTYNGVEFYHAQINIDNVNLIAKITYKEV